MRYENHIYRFENLILKELFSLKKFGLCHVFLAFTLVVPLGFQTASSQTVQLQPELYPHESKPFNVTMGEWLQRYWIWFASMPIDENPRYDTTGMRCGNGQQGPVWFLDAEYGSRVIKTYNCEIPQDKAIFVPLLVGECDYGDQPPSDNEITDCASVGNNNANVEFSIDGRKLLSINGTDNEDLSRARSGFFNISWAQPNEFSAKPGIFRGVADGYFVIIKPLPAGNYQFAFHHIVYNYDEFKNKLPVQEQDIKYNITIVEG